MKKKCDTGTFNFKIMNLVSKNNVSHQKCELSDKLKSKEFIRKFNFDIINIPKNIKIIGKKINKGFDFSKFEYPLVIKCNHGCGFHMIFNKYEDIHDKDIDKINNFINLNFVNWHGEYQYCKINRLIYIEEFINIKYLHEYYCFHGKPLYIQKNYRDYEKNVKYINQYDINYNKFEFRWSKASNYDLTPKTDFDDKLLEYTKIICKDFDFVRVDYNVDFNDKVWFSELTFSPCAGYLRFKNNNMNRYFGSLI